MNLHENIIRIKQMMGVINEDNRPDVFKKMIDELGVTSAIKMVGNYYMIEPYLKVIDKVNFIKEKIRELGDDYCLEFMDISEEPLHISDEDDEIHQIELLTPKSALISVYDEEGHHINDYNVNYESLPVQIIEELVEILLNH